jgi:hypothetical protein
MPCKPNRHPANSIRHAYSRYEYVCANILALTCYFRQYYWSKQGKLVSSYWLKFAPLRLFVETMPIYKAVATGNGIISFTEKQHVQTANNPLSPQSYTNAQRLLASQPTLFFVTIYL